MINGIPYPVAPDFKKIIEEKRMEFARSQGIKPKSISQARFTKLLIPIIKQAKINPQPLFRGFRGPIINKNVFKKTTRR